MTQQEDWLLNDGVEGVEENACSLVVLGQGSVRRVPQQTTRDKIFHICCRAADFVDLFFTGAVHLSRLKIQDTHSYTFAVWQLQF